MHYIHAGAFLRQCHSEFLPSQLLRAKIEQDRAEAVRQLHEAGSPESYHPTLVVEGKQLYTLKTTAVFARQGSWV